MLFRGCLAEGPTIRYLRTGQAVSNWIFFALTWRRLDKAVCAWGWVSYTHWEKGNFPARFVPGITSSLNVAAICGMKHARDGRSPDHARFRRSLGNLLSSHCFAFIKPPVVALEGKRNEEAFHDRSGSRVLRLLCRGPDSRNHPAKLNRSASRHRPGAQARAGVR